MRRCEFCGHSFPDKLGRYGCPNCNGEGMKTAEEKDARRKIMAELRNARKAFQNARYTLRKASENVNYCDKRLVAAAKAAGKIP